ncbi:MAG: hypothetical protein HZA53_04635 [Planctomycetes bacterium]|nr:hypothetical protein [Planctomycetota bacterium]
MIKKPYSKQDAERLLPLMIAIGHELDERSTVIAQLEARLSSLPSAHDPQGKEAAGIVSELSAHRRELRYTESELSRLGCSIDADQPLRIVCPANIGVWAYDLTSGRAHSETKPNKRRS